MTVIRNATNIAKTFAKELKATGLKRTSKDLEGLESVFARPFDSKGKSGRMYIDVERYADSGSVFRRRVVARDTFITSKRGKPKLHCSQLMSDTGSAYIVPGKKGFLGIGKREPYFEVGQGDFKTNSLLENMCLRASGTLDNPKNPVLSTKEGSFILTIEKAKQFIEEVLKGIKQYSSHYTP